TARSSWLTSPLYWSSCPKTTPITGIARTYGRESGQRWQRQPRSPSKRRIESRSEVATRIGTAIRRRALWPSAVLKVGSDQVTRKLSVVHAPSNLNDVLT